MAEYIEREKLIKEIADIINTAPMIHVMGLGLALGCARSAPAAEVQPVRHGRWEREQPHTRHGIGYWKCSECNQLELLQTPFCPNCGTKMDGGNG